MKNIIKGCLLFVLFFLVLGLFGCENSKVSYKDPTTGEEKQITIEKTENDQEVVDSIYAVALSETPIKSLKTETITIEFSAKLKIKAKDGTIEEVETQGKLTASAEIGYDENITSLNDLFKASKASVKLEFKGRVPNSEGKQEYFYTSTVELFVEENIVYGKVKLNNKLLSFIEREDEEVGKKLSELNEKVFKYEFDSSIPASPLSDEMKDTLAKVFKEESGISIKQYLEEDGTSFKDLRAQIEEMVIAYGITI
ncbi:MAG: hypothetical protein J5666_07795, partial [Bacilli bacterium]|nr:hypothetical protein [Bacilli bacterium]